MLVSGSVCSCKSRITEADLAGRVVSGPVPWVERPRGRSHNSWLKYACMYVIHAGGMYVSTGNGEDVWEVV